MTTLSAQQQHAATRLIVQAYEAAARKGKEDWHQMRGAVLKNRLLDITGQSFSERDYGANNFREFIEALGEVVAVDDSYEPYLLTLQPTYVAQIDSSPSTTRSKTKLFIRSDLWNAIVNYRRAPQWIWDTQSREAQPLTDAIDVETGHVHVLPTWNAEQLRDWRSDFATKNDDGLEDSEAKTLWKWASEGLSAYVLPVDLGERWNASVTERVRSQLEDFFQSNQLPLPDDFLVDKSAVKTQTDVTQLREFVGRCIELMSEDELLHLPIPAYVAMRASR